jgi:hypothetical protein
MKRYSLLCLAVLLMGSGCRDVRDQTPLEATSVKASLSAGADGRDAAAAESTVCLSYRKHLVEQRAALARSDDNAVLLERVATFEGLVENACE